VRPFAPDRTLADVRAAIDDDGLFADRLLLFEIEFLQLDRAMTVVLCQRADENRPVVSESKPATLR